MKLNQEVHSYIINILIIMQENIQIQQQFDKKINCLFPILTNQKGSIGKKLEKKKLLSKARLMVCGFFEFCPIFLYLTNAKVFNNLELNRC